MSNTKTSTARLLVQIGERLGTLETLAKAHSERVVRLEACVDALTLQASKQKSFIAGVVFTVSAVVSVLTAVLSYFFRTH